MEEEEEEEGVFHSDVRLIGKLLQDQGQAHQRALIGKDQPLQGLHKVGC